MIIVIQLFVCCLGGGSILILLPKESDDKNCIIMQLKLSPYTTYTWKINIGVTGVNPGLIAFLSESPHVTSICCFGSLPNRTSLRECLPDSISTGRVSSQGWGSLWPSPAPGSLLKNKPLCLRLDPEISTRAARNHVQHSAEIHWRLSKA